MKPALHGILTMLAFLVSMTTFAASSQFDYIPPTNLALSLQPREGAGGKGASIPLIGTIEPRTGIPTRLQIFFEASDDLRVTPASATLDRLASPTRFEMLVRPASGIPDAGGTWVRMRVLYTPDYPAQAREMNDPRRYPEKGERDRVLHLISRNQKEQARQTDAVRYFPPSPSSR